jgi:hypothetical protein
MDAGMGALGLWLPPVKGLTSGLRGWMIMGLTKECSGFLTIKPAPGAPFFVVSVYM